MAKEKLPPKITQTHWFFRLSESEQDQILDGLDKWFSLLRGKTDVKARIQMLLDPDNILTSSILTPSQVRFVSKSVWLADQFPLFDPLADYAFTFALTRISQGGTGQENAIRFVSALQESKLLRNMQVLAKQGEKVE